MNPGVNKRCWAEVDLAALERNVGCIRAALPKGIKYISVVKADAYGHGMPQVVPRLMHSFVDCFAVANVREAVTIREIGKGWPILVLSAVLPEEDSLVVEYDLAVTLSTPQEVERFDKLGEKKGKPIAVHLKIDTGMGRLGVWHECAEELYKKIQNAKYLKPEGICTHFSAADVDPDFTRRQRSLFIKLLKDWDGINHKDMLIHVDNSAGLESFTTEGGANAVRIGIMQFGILPNPNSLLKDLGVEPVFGWKSRVGLVKYLPKGANVSYGRTYCLTRPSRIAILTAGYGDGISLGLSNRGEVIIRGKRFPVIGRVTMDQTVIDVTDGPEVNVGDVVTLIGQDGDASIGVTEWSRWANTIEWDVYCSISKRVPRNYLNNTFS